MFKILNVTEVEGEGLSVSERFAILGKPELVGIGVKRKCGATVYGRATHFQAEHGRATLCGAAVSYDLEDDDWVSCRLCMAHARQENS